jgi:putative flippase GtrA
MRELISKLLRYAITGGIAAIVDVGVFALLIKVDLGIAPASVLSFCLAALVNYRLTSQFVFSQDATIYGFTRFLVAAGIGLAANVGVTLIGAFVLGLPPLIAKLVGIGTAFFANFALNMLIVFRTRCPPSSVEP